MATIRARICKTFHVSESMLSRLLSGQRKTKSPRLAIALTHLSGQSALDFLVPEMHDLFKRAYQKEANGFGTIPCYLRDHTYPNASEFRRMRKVVISESNGMCEQCGKPGVLIHHKDGTRSNHKRDNLENLCPLCHRRVHTKNKTPKNGGLPK
jgi:hypothetical protein